MSGSNDKSDLDRLLVNKVARAIFESQRLSEIERRPKLEIDLNKFDLFAQIATSRDSYKILISGWALISYTMAEALKIHATHAKEKDKKELFGPLGPLGTDSGRIRLARAFGWIPANAQLLLDDIRKARNKIAHEVDSAANVDLQSIFSSPYRRTLEDTLERAFSVMKEASVEFELNDDIRRYASLFVLLAQTTFEWVLWGPSRERLGLPTETVPTFFNYEEAPAWAQELNKAVVRAIYVIHSK